jgi:error-prone DNA polymerase
MELGGFSAGEADELRRAIGFTRSQDRLNKMKDKLGVSLKANGVTPAAIESVLQSLSSFALYGFPESHAISFAMIAYSSAWLKVHRAAAFYAGLLNNQPMGFYSPATLVQDARRRGVKTLPVCVLRSDFKCEVVADDTIRLGFGSVRGLRRAKVDAMLVVREKLPFTSMADFLRRTQFSAAERRALAKAGALNALSGHRRAALWEVEASHVGDELFRIVAVEEVEPVLSPLERMSHLERLQADFETLGLTTGPHPMRLMRAQLPDLWTAADLKNGRAGDRVKIGGSVITRQRPGTAKGFCFITIEDETGHANAIVRPRMFEECRMVINLEPALMIIGRLQNAEGVIHVMAEEITALPALGMPVQSSHDFH